MKEDKETVELNALNKGKPAPNTPTKSTPFWNKLVCFITGDIPHEEMDKILSREKEIYDHRKTQEIPANIKKISK